MYQKVDVMIPTYKPGETFRKLMEMLKNQTYPIGEILIMNTEEKYFPEETYRDWHGVRVIHLTREEFDHGGTRDRAANFLAADLCLFMTQDAVPKDEHLVENLVKCFEDPKVWAAYARQLPKQDCSLIERYTRSFNYPDKSRVKSKADMDKMGIKTFFCSNVCAMYRMDRYREYGGFEKHTIFNEDMIFAGKLILNGGAVAYAADAMVYHSHNYSCLEQLHRNFDLAVSQKQHPEIFGLVSSESEGIRLVKQTASYLAKAGKPWLLPELILQSGFKFLGYRLGKCYDKLPDFLVNALSMNKHYWKKQTVQKDSRNS